jgi:hypothetical protein
LTGHAIFHQSGHAFESEVSTMIWFIATALVALVCIALTIGVMEAHQRAAWRVMASERKNRWLTDQEEKMGD